MINVEAKDRIKNLLMHSGQSALLSDRPALLNSSMQEYRTSRALPLKELRSVYKIRAAINTRNGSPIKGFDELLHEMETMGDELIRISTLSTVAGLFIVFTDAEVERIVGVLFKPATGPHSACSVELG